MSDIHSSIPIVLKAYIQAAKLEKLALEFPAERVMLEVEAQIRRKVAEGALARVRAPRAD